jgi:hypothetical protein
VEGWAGVYRKHVERREQDGEAGCEGRERTVKGTRRRDRDKDKEQRAVYKRSNKGW